MKRRDGPASVLCAECGRPASVNYYTGNAYIISEDGAWRGVIHTPCLDHSKKFKKIIDGVGQGHAEPREGTNE